MRNEPSDIIMPQNTTSRPCGIRTHIQDMLCIPVNIDDDIHIEHRFTLFLIQESTQPGTHISYTEVLHTIPRGSAMKISVEKIVVPDERARARYSDEQRVYLRASLGKYGQLSEILVRRLPDGRYELIDGESRLNELVKAGASGVDVKVLALTDKDASMVNLLMNVARGEQAPMGVSLTIAKAMEAGMIMEEVAAATGHTVPWVKFMLMLRDLPEAYQDALEKDELKVTHIREATRLPNPKEVDAALGAAIRFGWNTSVMKNYVDNRMAEYRAVEAMKRRTGVEVPPPPPEPQRLARYAQCLVCGEMVEKERLNLPRVCSDCYTYAKYAVTQCGKGEQGMQRLFKALELQQAFEQQRRQFLLSEDLRQQPLKTSSSLKPGGEPTFEPDSITIKPEDVSAEEWGKLKARVRRMQP